LPDHYPNTAPSKPRAGTLSPGREITNKAYDGDNQEVLREHIADESVDLMRLDPPFNSNRSYDVISSRHAGDGDAAAQIQAFDDDRARGPRRSPRRCGLGASAWRGALIAQERTGLASGSGGGTHGHSAAPPSPALGRPWRAVMPPVMGGRAGRAVST
jgi:hypothetical protein